LSGELADRTVLSADANPEGVRRSSAVIERGRTTSGRGRHHVVVYLLAATSPGAQDRLWREYQLWGLEPGKEAGVAGVAGDADEVARAAGEFARAGAGTVVLQPTTDEPDMAGFARFVAQQVRPLVKGPNDLDGLFAPA
jgi:alkanesulfonate monooxygenase SsuD/methylene tetrahydromethanopterin reductase-like flavin-dependent oxidoreductase (luciferase family)